MTPTTAWPEIDPDAEIGSSNYVDKASVALLATVSQDALKGQVEGGRLLVTRSYVVLGQAITLVTAAIASIGVITGATSIAPTGWAYSPYVLLGLYVAAIG